MASFFFVSDSAKHPANSAPERTGLAPEALHHSAEDSGLLPTPSSLRRTEVCPPSLFSRSGPQWKRWVTGFWAWLWDMDESADRAPVLTGLNKGKAEFCAAMWDLQSVRATQVRDAIGQARSLRELWHLRPDVFRTISTHRGQTVANARIEALNNHFPVRISSHTSEPKQARTTSW
ncbi:MAG: hypothetical protein KGL90_08465 [Burkholderiales bacterium]|nr:hypothetical protein [Burkholderiales bacterium]